MTWRLKHKGAPGRLWRYIEEHLMLSKNHLKKVRQGKFKPRVTVINFKDWYRD